MPLASYPSISAAPILPGAVPCYRTLECELETASRRQRWDNRCTRILLGGDGHRSNAEVSRLIEAQTGLRFSASVISRHRGALGGERARRNDWTSPLRRWKPWQGHLVDES